MLARKHSQPCVLRDPRVGRARLAIEQSHIPKKIAAMEFSKRDLVPLLRSHTDTDLSLLDYIHRVAFVTGAKKNCAGFTIEALEQPAQFMSRLGVERLKQWYMA